MQRRAKPLHPNTGGGWLSVFAFVVLLFGIFGCERKPCSNECEWHGLCTPNTDDCVAANDGDCRESKACRWYGKCSAIDSKCTTTDDEDCQISNKCTQAGQCKFRTGKRGKEGKCVAARDADCKKSEFCAKSGLCHLKKNGTCAQ